MTTMDLMCLTYTNLRECRGYHKGMCSGCSRRDVIMIRICDKCRMECEPDELEDVDGMELCKECKEGKTEWEPL